MRLGAAALVLVAWVRVANADADADAEATFRAADARADIAALEQLGAARPVTRWTDDALAEAARFAEHIGDYARARRDLEGVLAIGTDDQLVRRSRAELARLAAFAGDAGQWSVVAGAHDRLAERVLEGGGDPQPAIAELEALVRANPRYPRAAMAMLVIARGLERDGDATRAIAWLREAKQVASAGVDRNLVVAELTRALIRRGDLAEASDELDGLANAVIAGELRDRLAAAQRRHVLRVVLWAELALIAIAAAILLRRNAGSWRDGARRLARPPTEVMFFAPIGIVLIAIAYGGNPMIARAVDTIVIAGIAIGWVSGAILEAVRRAHGRVGLPRAAGHAVVAALAVASATYLAIDHNRMIDLVVETWREGPAMR